MPKLMFEHHFYGELIVAAIEYRRIKLPRARKFTFVPHSVFCASRLGPNYCHVFDFDWCKRDATLFYHCSGSGGRTYIHRLSNPRAHVPLWFDGELGRPADGGKISRRTLSNKTITAFGYKIIDAPLPVLGAPNPFSEGIEGEVEYCAKCNDWLPTDSLCSHIFWCERHGMYGGAASDPCGCKEPSEI